MRRFLAVVIIATVLLSACASEPTLSHHEIDRVHSVKVVYIQAPDALGVFRDQTGGNIMPVPMGGGATLFMPVSEMTGPNILTEDYLLATYQREIGPLDVRQQLFAAANQAIPQVSWLAKAPFSVVDHPMDDDAMWHDIVDSNLDAVIYLEPTEALEYLGRFVRVGIKVTVYANIPTRGAYRYDSVLIGNDQEIQLKQDPNKPHRSISALDPKQLASVWFSDDAAQLHSDLELELPQIEPGLVHYLAGDAAPEK